MVASIMGLVQLILMIGRADTEQDGLALVATYPKLLLGTNFFYTKYTQLFHWSKIHFTIISCLK